MVEPKGGSPTSQTVSVVDQVNTVDLVYDRPVYQQHHLPDQGRQHEHLVLSSLDAAIYFNSGMMTGSRLLGRAALSRRASRRADCSPSACSTPCTRGRVTTLRARRSPASRSRPGGSVSPSQLIQLRRSTHGSLRGQCGPAGLCGPRGPGRPSRTSAAATWYGPSRRTHQVSCRTQGLPDGTYEVCGQATVASIQRRKLYVLMGILRSPRRPFPCRTRPRGPSATSSGTAATQVTTGLGATCPRDQRGSQCRSSLGQHGRRSDRDQHRGDDHHCRPARPGPDRGRWTRISAAGPVTTRMIQELHSACIAPRIVPIPAGSTAPRSAPLQARLDGQPDTGQARDHSQRNDPERTGPPRPGGSAPGRGPSWDSCPELTGPAADQRGEPPV